MPRNNPNSLKRSSRDAGSKKQSGNWHAVEIRCTRYACDAARAAAGKRFLSLEAPFLPLPECDRSANCECVYRHRNDRRVGPRREADGAAPTGMTMARSDRRALRGRRHEDKAVWELEREKELEDTRFELTDTYYEYVDETALRKKKT